LDYVKLFLDGRRHIGQWFQSGAASALLLLLGIHLSDMPAGCWYDYYVSNVSKSIYL